MYSVPRSSAIASGSAAGRDASRAGRPGPPRRRPPPPRSRARPPRGVAADRGQPGSTAAGRTRRRRARRKAHETGDRAEERAAREPDREPDESGQQDEPQHHGETSRRHRSSSSQTMRWIGRRSLRSRYVCARGRGRASAPPWRRPCLARPPRSIRRTRASRIGEPRSTEPKPTIFLIVGPHDRRRAPDLEALPVHGD